MMSSKLSPEEYQELGRTYYKLKQYDRAAEAFNQGLELSPSVNLYDHRAATHEKLQDFNSAVKDGREMIRLDKKNVKGYLRTASLLEKVERPEKALGIYKYGMKNVPVEDKNFKLLQQLHDKLTRKLSPATAIDPFTVLPVELAEMVLEYLSFRHMVNCMRVSKGWSTYLAKLPKLWLHLDMSGARKPVPRAFVGKTVKRSECRLTRVTVHRFEHLDVVTNIAKLCHELTELEFITLPHTISTTLIGLAQLAPHLKKIIVHPEITIDAATSILRARPSLEHVVFGAVKHFTNGVEWQGPFSRLRVFQMNMVEKSSARQTGLASLFGQTPALQSLTITNMSDLMTPALQASFMPPLTSLVLKRVQFDMFPPLPTTLQRLVVEYLGSYSLAILDSNLLRPNLPNLTDLSLWGMEGLSADRMEDLLDTWLDDNQQRQPSINACPLHSLSIRSVLTVTQHETGLFKGPDSLFCRSPRILTPALESLDIATLSCDDDEIEQLLTYNTGIQSIDLSFTDITGASIKMLADKLPNLITIKADHCTRINGRDAIAYAERKGISVSCKMGEQKGGRKIRYG